MLFQDRESMPYDGRGGVAVLVPAAGEGRRMGGHRKQFRRLGGHPVLVQTLRVFERHADVGALVVAAPPDAAAALRQELQAIGLSKLLAVVPGGANRQESVSAALAATPEEVEIVLVHDAVRPFVEASLVSSVIRAVQEHGAAAPAVQVADTLRRGEGAWFVETVPRHGLYRMQTPQGFRRDWLWEAHLMAREAEIVATDDVELVQRAGRRVRIVEGSPRNFKITTTGDWELAQIVWPHWSASQRLDGSGDTRVS